MYKIPTMKKLLILAALFLSLQSFAQITLVESDLPTDGDSRVVSILNDLGTFDFVSTGANYTWDFSQMVPQSQDTIAFISASNTSLPVTYIAAFNNFVTDPEHDADVANYQDYGNPMPTVTIEDLDTRITKVEPVIDDVSKWRERAIGARMTVTIFVASIGGGIAFAAQWLWTHFAGKSG